MALGRISGRRGRLAFGLAAVVFAAFACAASIRPGDETPESIAKLAEDVANKIWGDFDKRRSPLPPVISGPEGLRIAEGWYPDPKKLAPLRRLYLLFLSAGDGDIIVLACDPRTGLKLFEDATCTPKIDVRAWESSEAANCMPALDTREVCR